ncbi:hypothetical protein BHE74_00036242 [Ensete ventricosum]|nr:hypothetical protein BHE74_00036242 [Ensete ventricosum]
MNLGLRKYGSQKMPKENNEMRRNSYTRLLVAGSEIGVKFFSEVFFLIGRVLRWHEPRDDKRKYDFGMMQGEFSLLGYSVNRGEFSLLGYSVNLGTVLISDSAHTRQCIILNYGLIVAVFHPRRGFIISGVNVEASRSHLYSDDVLGSRWKFARRFAEGIGKLAGNTKGDRQKEDRRTCRKIARGCRNIRELSLN